ncbi:class IV lanthionine synthetase LanL [Streptomyces sp. NPDC059063]|uniref:class IV lanthionine synthetase LanL n=1 Tax=unclassified Streptomyces TaxID=2593676 RepID=UPI003692BEB1
MADYKRLRDELAPRHGWRHDVGDMWCYVTPPGSHLRTQGWKIHLSATPRSAVDVLTAATRVLFQQAAAFKFAHGTRQLRSLLSIRMDRGSGGKFITVYPDSDEQFVELLGLLDEATRGLDGPAILSDRRYRDGGLVHYRYGGFSGSQQVLDVDGSYVPMLVAPDGGWERDQRNGWFSPPSWALLPAGVPSPAADRAAESGDRSKVLLNDRFMVYEAIRHSNRGGVYRALDCGDGDRKVVIKEARPFIGAEHDGTDARDYLRNEHATLSALAPLGVAPRPVDLFDYQGHLFLAEEEVPGTTLRTWVEQHVVDEPTRALPLSTVLPLARRVLDIVRTVHDKGFVLRDLTPSNVMVTPDSELMLIDTEFAAVPGELVTRVQTPSYAAPEELTGPTRYPAPTASADLYGVGATLFYLCTGAHPVIAADGLGEENTPQRPYDERVRWLVHAVAVNNPALAALSPLVRGLMRREPGRRITLVEAGDLLDGVRNTAATAPDALSLRTDDPERLLTDGWRQLVRGMTPDDNRSLWPAPPMEGRLFDTLAVQAGAGGTLEVMRRGSGTHAGAAELGAALRTALNWLDLRADRERRQLPGLYFGRAGTYWAMYEAADTLGDHEVRHRSVERAKHLPVVWANPDITHGVAGNGLAQLHLWRRTGDAEFRERAELCVRAVLAKRTPDGLKWPVPAQMSGADAGLAHYGFAHGVAGISTFLLAAARELNRPDLLESAVASGDFLLSAAAREGAGLAWPAAHRTTDSAPSSRVCWWCSGAPGIGAFLIRLWRATGEDRFREAAHRAAIGTRSNRWLQSASHCHGLAGNGEFLLDMAAATGDVVYRAWADEHVASLYRLAALYEGRLVILDETNAGMTYSYNLGMAGPIGFLHRSLHGGERWWMVDDFALAPRGGER